jgi:hypothetical protein
MAAAALDVHFWKYLENFEKGFSILGEVAFNSINFE